MTVFEQDGFDLRVEWGLDGVRALGSHCAVLVIVDVLVFSTSVNIAVEQGARVLPLPWRDGRAAEAAGAAGATLIPTGLVNLAGQPTATSDPGWTLRPSSLVGSVPDGTFLAISSANGSHLSAAAAESGATVLAGCLRNASAVATKAVELAGDRPIGVIAAGERWKKDGEPLRPSIEDYLGAGAIVAAVNGRSAPSPEATLAGLAYRAGQVPELVADSISGRELTVAGVPKDVALAAEVNVSSAVPVLTDGVYRS